MNLNEAFFNDGIFVVFVFLWYFYGIIYVQSNLGTLNQNFSLVNHHSAFEIVSFVNGNSINGHPFLSEILFSANSLNLVFQVYI